MSKPRKKKGPPKRVLALPDLEQSKAAVLNTLTSKSGQRSYDRAITDFVDWYCSEPRLAFNRTVVLRYRIFLEQKQYAATTINLRLAAVRRVAFEAADSGLLSPELAAGIRRVKGVRRIGVRVGNWLTAEQAKKLLAVADRGSLRGKRDHAMIAMLVGCGLRRGELLVLRVDSIQSRDEHWVIADLLGKAGHIRTVPIPSWVKAAIDERKEAGCITEGALFRSINKTGRVWGTGMTPRYSGRSSEPPRNVPELKNSRRMIFGAAARGSAILPVASWTRSNFCLDTSRSKRRNGTSAASRNCALPSTTEWASNRTIHRLRSSVCV
jgi:integrase